jgi:hypothetical protein
MSWRLKKDNLENRVCLFERNDHYGGRIKDIFFEQVPSVSAGMGAWRINGKHCNMWEMVQDFNITWEEWNFDPEPKLEARGVFSNDSNVIRNIAFSTLEKGRFANFTDDDMWR